VVALFLCHFTLATPHLGDALLGDALSWRRFLLATPALGITPTWAAPYIDFDLDFVNAWVQDGTDLIL